MADLYIVVLPGLIVGLLFGFTLQRGRFCMNSAFRDVLLLKEYTLLKAVALAIVIQMILFHLMVELGILGSLYPIGFTLFGSVVGGFIFGIGMALAAGCASGTSYRVGEGMVGSLLALLGLVHGAWLVKNPLIVDITNFKNDTAIFADDGSTTLTLGNILGVDGDLSLLVVAVIAIVTIVFIVWKYLLPWYKSTGGKIDLKGFPSNIYSGSGWKWWVTGIVIALIGSLAFITSVEAGRNYPLGITAGWLGIFNGIMAGNFESLGWINFMILGLVVGAFIAALISKEFKIRVPNEPKTLFVQFLGGMLMGIGAVTAGGCNIGNTLSGIPQLSVGSIITTVFIIAGTWLAAYFLFMRED